MLNVLVAGSIIVTGFALCMTVVRIRTILRSLDAIDRREPKPPMAPWLPLGSIVSMLLAPLVSALTAFMVMDRVDTNMLSVVGFEFIASMLCVLLSALNMIINFSIYDRSRPAPTYW
jgi:hypothetical protein